MRTTLLLACLLLLASAAAGEEPAGSKSAAPALVADDAAVLDVLVVADTDDPKIGRHVDEDLSIMEWFFRVGVPAPRLKVTVLRGMTGATRQRIQAHYRRQGPSSNRARVFYFAGHGRWGKDGPDIQLPDGDWVPRDTLRAWVAQGDPRLAVILTDVCSTYHGPWVGEGDDRAPPHDPRTFRDLFFRHTGRIEITAASRGQVALGTTEGGYFTQGLVRALAVTPRLAPRRKGRLDRNLDGIVGWDEAMIAIRHRTGQVFHEHHAAGYARGTTVQREQTPLLLANEARSHGRVIPRSEYATGLLLADEGAKDVRVTGARAGSPAAWAGVPKGLLLREVRWFHKHRLHEYPVRRASDLQVLLARAPSRGVITLALERPSPSGDKALDEGSRPQVNLALDR
ncbi:MAG: hypothetical protein P1V36_17735 [Planctomycetota bacterium]|nr:hypothetical protein [Planctomycetota bacterium]